MNRPELRLGPHLVPGLAAVALFVVFAIVFAGAAFGQPAGFDETVSEVNLDEATGTNVSSVELERRDGTVVAATYENESFVDRVTVYEGEGADVTVEERDGETWAVATVGVTEGIGYALIDGDYPGIGGEGFLAALIIIALALDAALDGAIHLARREDEGTGGDRE